MNKALLIAGSVTFLLLVLVLFVLVLPACGARPTFGGLLPQFCPDVPRPDRRLAAADADRRALEKEIADLEQQLASLSCPAPERLPLDDLPGEQSTAEVPPEEEPPQEEPPQEEPPEEEQTMEEVIEEGDEEALSGCWDLSSDYTIRDHETGDPYPVDSWEICFDESGQGRQRLRYENGVQCEGPVRAAVSGGQVTISDVGDLPCDNNSRIFERVTTCRIASDGSTQCVQTQERTRARGTIEIQRKPDQ